MKRISILPVLFCCVCSLTACGQKTGSETVPPDTFPLPEVPSIYVLPGERADYISVHFWDRAVLSGADTVTPALEQAFADFTAIASLAATTDSVNAGIREILRKGSPDLIMPLAETYLWDADSPMRNEALFAQFLEAAPEWERGAPLMELVAKNRPGTKAADFAFTTLSGRRTTLSEFADSQPRPFYVYFYDSGCNVCKDMIPNVAAMAADGAAVLAVCPLDNAGNFEDTAPLFPGNWTVARDMGDIDGRDLYHFQAFPSLYLISPGMSVLAKDIRIE